MNSTVKNLSNVKKVGGITILIDYVLSSIKFLARQFVDYSKLAY